MTHPAPEANVMQSDREAELQDALEQAVTYLERYKLMPKHKREQFRAALTRPAEGKDRE